MVNATFPSNLQPHVNWHANAVCTIFAFHFPLVFIRPFGPSEYVYLGLKLNASIHWTSLVNADNSSLKEVYVFFGFRAELNLSLIETRRKAHNKPINTLSGLVHAGERLRNL